MNSLIHFSTGALSTFAFCNSLLPSDLCGMLTRQMISLIGGVLSAVLIAWLKRRWDDRGNGTAPV